MANFQLQTEFRHCPFSNSPFDNCATKNITGSSIARISRYCMSDYVACPVFASHRSMINSTVLDAYSGEIIFQKEGAR